MRAERCSRDAAHFIDAYCQVEDRAAGSWLPFRLWDSQRELLGVLRDSRWVVALKARQLGWTWVVLAKALHLMLFRRVAVLLFSTTDAEAKELMRRLVGMYDRLPAFLRQPTTGEPSQHGLTLANGGAAMAFPTTGRSGRSYTAGFVLIDEADHIGQLDDLLTAVKPTVDMAGQLVLLSTADKRKPNSPFKQIYRAAKAGDNAYRAVFHGWQARPGRDAAWYAERVRECPLAQSGVMDRVHQEYPATDVESLAPNSLDKRIHPDWLLACYAEQRPLDPLPEACPAVPGLAVYAPPRPGRLYAIGADPAEGNPTSDESAFVVLDARTGEECAALAGRLQPSVFAEHLNAVGCWYNRASAMVERNNHGHAVLLWLEANGQLPLLLGHDGRPGWMSSVKGKALLYEACADAFRRKETVLHSFGTLTQLQSIEGATLRAPDGEHDDRADAYALAVVGALAAIVYLHEQADARDSIAYT